MHSSYKPVGTLIEEFDIDELPTLNLRKLALDPNLPARLRRIVFGTAHARVRPLREKDHEGFRPAEFISNAAQRSVVMPSGSDLVDADDAAEFLRRHFPKATAQDLLVLYAQAWTAGCPTYKPEDARIQQLVMRPRLAQVSISPEQSTPKVYGPVRPAALSGQSDIAEDPRNRLQTTLAIANVENLISMYKSAVTDNQRVLIEGEIMRSRQPTTQRLSDISVKVSADSAVVFGGLDEPASIAIKDQNAHKRQLSRSLNVSVLDKFRRMASGEQECDGDLTLDHIEFDRELHGESSGEERERAIQRSAITFEDRVAQLKRARGVKFVAAADPARYLAPISPAVVRDFAEPAELQQEPNRPERQEEESAAPLWRAGGDALDTLKMSLRTRFQGVGSEVRDTGPQRTTESKERTRTQTAKDYDCFCVVFRQTVPDNILGALQVSTEPAPTKIPSMDEANLIVADHFGRILREQPDHPLNPTMHSVLNKAQSDTNRSRDIVTLTANEKRAHIMSALFD